MHLKNEPSFTIQAHRKNRNGLSNKNSKYQQVHRQKYNMRLRKIDVKAYSFVYLGYQTSFTFINPKQFVDLLAKLKF